MTPPISLHIPGKVGDTMDNKSNDDRFPSRKHPRLKSYDYSTPNYYFVTICTWQKKCLFGTTKRLNDYGKIAENGILQIEKNFPDVRVDKFTVMPNHVHLILDIQRKSSTVSTIIGQYKAFVTKEIRKIENHENIWQTSFHDHVIRDQKAYEKIWLYIDSNPKNWEKDCFFENQEVKYK